MNDINDPRLDKLDEALARVPTHAAPERDLWPAIAAAIDAPQASAPGAWRLASLAATIMLGALAAFYLLPSEPDVAMPVIAEETGSVDEPAMLEPELPAFDAPAMMLTSYPGEAYGIAREEKLEGLREQIENLPPDQRQIVETNLATIRKALADIDAALADDPDSKALKELLVKTYQQELNTIDNVSRITQSARIDL